MVVDDHVLVREGVANFLREASDAEEALKMLAAARSDVCLIDPRLPGRDGLYLIREMHARERKRVTC